ncbi:MAG: hydroxymethylpyrimidine/phosphomethylpyrimidine kinase [Rickettsiales bacterium]|jgi:hydroxymethylpyrimidine/phosphomethylpyrimidine kinase
MQNKILIIAGSDPSGGAGIQADIKTATFLKTYCCAVPTCLTAQNTQKVSDIFYPPASFLANQIKAVLEDIKISAIKIGMVGNEENIKEIARILNQNAKNIPIITDPVMVATSGDSLFAKNAIEFLKEKLISVSYLTTPNIPEAEILADMKIKNIEDIKIAARKIQQIGTKNVLIKGGHLDFPKNKVINYLLLENGSIKIFSNKKLPFKDIHGTGCTLSSAITCFLVQNLDLESAVKKANLFVYNAIKNGGQIGGGSRVLKHF